MSYETIKGGFGARPTKDGITGVAAGISNTMNTPIEILEMSFPVRVERYEIVPDTGGAGRHRGGCGVERVWRILGNPSQVSVCLERTKSAPFGLAGGGAGGAGRIAVIGPDGNERELEQQGRLHGGRPAPRSASARPARAASVLPPSATAIGCGTTWSTATSRPSRRLRSTATRTAPRSSARPADGSRTRRLADPRNDVVAEARPSPAISTGDSAG